MTWHNQPEMPNVFPEKGSQQGKINSAIEILEGAIGEGNNTLFLWTGGKEAQVIADLLLYAVGDNNGVSPVPFGVIDTGNHFEEMYDFREEYVSMTGDRGANTVGPETGISDVVKLRYDEMIDRVIDNDSDPRGYHGRWDFTKELPEEDPIDGLPRSAEEWDIASSCGVLKTVPIRRFIEEYGYGVLITGRRGSDPILPESGEGLEAVSETREPVKHTRVNPLHDWSEANVYAYIKSESVSLPSLYTEEGYRHTDAKCCTEDGEVGEYGEGGRDPRKVQQRQELEDMGYI